MNDEVIDAVRMLTNAIPSSMIACANQATDRLDRGDVAVPDGRDCLEGVPERLGQTLEFLTVDCPDDRAADQNRQQLGDDDDEDGVSTRAGVADEPVPSPSSRQSPPR